MANKSDNTFNSTCIIVSFTTKFFNNFTSLNTGHTVPKIQSQQISNNGHNAKESC